MEKKEKSSKLISSLVALSLATTLGVPTIALADTANAEQPTATQQQTTGISTTTVTEGDAQGEETTPPQETKTVAMVGKRHIRLCKKPSMKLLMVQRSSLLAISMNAHRC